MRVMENVLLIALVVGALLLCADWYLDQPVLNLGSLVTRALQGGAY